MPAGRIVVPPYFPARNRENQLLAGALLYVYENETTTKALIYTNETMTTLSSNPVVANASGQFPAVFAEAGSEAAPVLYSISVTTADGGSPGNPFNFDNYRPSVDWETATLALAEAAADAAETSAAEAAVSANEAEAALAEIEDIVENSPDAPSVLNKLNINGSNVGTQAATLRSNIGAASSAALALSSGASLIGSIQDGTGAVFQSVQQALRVTVNVKQFGAVGDGTTNDTPFIQAAIDKLGVKGGNVFIPNDMKCLIDTALTLKKSVSLVGPHKMVGSPGDNSSAPYGDLGGALIVNSSVTITMQSGSTVQGILFYRKGMTFPAPSSASFAGTCLTNDGDDVSVFNCMFLGFDMAFSSVGAGAGVGLNRMRIENVNMDCQNGIYIEACYDNPYIQFVHSWPFATIAASVSNPTTWYQRTGIAYHFKDIADWLSLNNCFSYGHAVGTKIDAVNSYVLNCPMHDGPSAFGISAGTWNASTNTPTLVSSTISPSSGNAYPYYTVSVAGSTNLNGIASWAVGDKAFFVNGVWTKVPPEVTPIANLNTGSVGIWIDGTAGGCEYGQIITPRIASQADCGIRVETNAGVTTNIIGGGIWACSQLAIDHVSGNLTVDGTLLRDTNTGIKVQTSTGQLNRDRVRFDNVGFPITATVATTNIFGDLDISNRGPGGTIITDNGNVTCPDVASDPGGPLPMNGEVFNITGTTDFGVLGPGWKDRLVTLIFEDALTVFTGTGSNGSMALYGGQNFNATPNDTLTLRHNGVQWFEVGRSGVSFPFTFTVASADPLAINATGQAFNVTGTTSFGRVANGVDGRVVTLIFTGVLTVFTTTGSGTDEIKLSNGVNFTTQNGSTLTIRHNGVRWYEIGRSA